MHFHVYKIIDINIFFRPEEAMFENWQKLVSLLKIVLFLRESILHDVKQNEKYPYTTYFFLQMLHSRQ